MAQNRIALITGANKGIGFETARQLGQQGITVLLGARDLAKGQEAAAKLKAEGLDVQPIQLDVTNPESVQNAVKVIQQQFGKLDILINNAGIFRKDDFVPVSQTSQEVLRDTFDTNVFGTIALTQAFLPLLRNSEAGRIVNLSSILGSLTEHSREGSFIANSKALGYNMSKTALNAFTVHLAHELKDTPIKVNSAHPGWVKTDMGGEDAPLDIETGAKTSVALATLPADGPTGGFYHLGEAMAW